MRSSRRVCSRSDRREGRTRAVNIEKGDILKSQLTFKDCGMTFKNFKDGDDFVKNYPFAPTSSNSSRGSSRRSAGPGRPACTSPAASDRSSTPSSRRPSGRRPRMSASWCRSTVSTRRSRASSTRRSRRRSTRPGTTPAWSRSISRLLQVLFLIRYVEEIKGNVDNLVTLCLDEIDADRLALRPRIEDSLGRLEKETLISRNGDVYFFLTNEERDINREIKAVELGSGEEAKLLGEIDLQRRAEGAAEVPLRVNKMDFTSTGCATFSGRQTGSMGPSGLGRHPAERRLRRCRERQGDPRQHRGGGCVLIRLGNDEILGRELRDPPPDREVRPPQERRHLAGDDQVHPQGSSDDNKQRRERLTSCWARCSPAADFYAAGQPLKLKATSPLAALDEALEYLVTNTFTRMGYLKHLNPDPPRRSRRSSGRTTSASRRSPPREGTSRRSTTCGTPRPVAGQNKPIVLHDLIEKRYAIRPTAGRTRKYCSWWPACSSWARSA